MAEPTTPTAGRQPSAAVTAALLAAAVVLTAGLTDFALRGHHLSTKHLVAAVGLPLFVGAIVLLVVARRRLLRVRLRVPLAVVVLLLPALAVLGPVAAVPHLRNLFALRVALALAGVGGLLWLILARPRWRFEAATYVFLFGAWFCWLVITLAWAPYPNVGPKYLFLFATLGAVAVAAASAGVSRRRLRFVLLTLAGVYGLSLLIGLAEIAVHRHLPTASPHYAHHPTPAAFCYNPNDFATYLTLCWPFALLLPYFYRSARTIALSAAAVLATLLVILSTGSRASLLALGLEVVIVAALLTLRAGRRARIAVGLLLVVALLGAGLLLTGHGGRYGKSFKITQVMSQIHSGSGSGGVRSELQIAGLRAASVRWFLGDGPGNAEPVVGQQNPSFTILNLHDWYLEVFVDGGLPALLAFLTIYLMLVVSMVRVARYAQGTDLRYLGAAMAIALAGFTVAIIGPSTPIKFPPMAIVFGLALAIVIRARRHDREVAASRDTPGGGLPAPPAPAAPRIC